MGGTSIDHCDIDASTADAILRIGSNFLELEGPCMMDLLLESGSEKAESRHVRFGQMHVREYSQVLGDHPCCQEGPPVTLGWDYSQEQTCSVDDYESKRLQCRRNRHELRLSFTDRREILSDVSDDEVRRGCRRLHRERRCSGKAMESFFGERLHIPVTE